MIFSILRALSGIIWQLVLNKVAVRRSALPFLPSVSQTFPLPNKSVKKLYRTNAYTHSEEAGIKGKFSLSLPLLAGILSILVPVMASAQPATIYLPDDYSTIQGAVDAANPGDTIIVRDGTYTENVEVNKDHFTIRSESGPEATIVQAANSNNDIFEITANYVTISGFKITGAIGSHNYSPKAIHLNSVNHCSILHNIITNNFNGIHISSKILGAILDNTITNNIILDNSNVGISIQYSASNVLENNILDNNRIGIYVLDANNNSLVNNVVSNNSKGIYLDRISSGNNVVTQNTIESNNIGIYLDNANNNFIYLNNFINNTYPAYSEEPLNAVWKSTNIWNSPEEITYTHNSNIYTNYLGNYWSNCEEHLPPVGHHDPDNQWQDEPLAYDEDTDTFANVHVGRNTCSSWLELFAPPGEATHGIRFWANKGSLRIEIYYDGTWHCLVDRSWPDTHLPSMQWVEVSYPSRIVEKARIRFTSGLWWGYNAHLHEFCFKTTSDYAGSDTAGDGIGDTPCSIGSDADNYPLMMPFENYKHTAETFDVTLSRVYLNTSGGTGPTLDDDFSQDYYDNVAGFGEVIRIEDAFSPPITEPCAPFYWFPSGTAGNTSLTSSGLDVTLPENQEICLVTPGGKCGSGIMEDTGQADFRVYLTNPANICEIISDRWTDTWVHITRVPYEETAADNVGVELEYGTGWYQGTYCELGVRLSLHWWISGVEQQSEPIILTLDNPSDVVGIRLAVTPTGGAEASYNVNAGAWQSLGIAALDWWSENYLNVAYNIGVENYREKEEVQVDVNTKYWESGDYQLRIEARAPVESVSSITISGPSYLDTATVNKASDPYSADYPKQLYNDGQHWDNEAGDEEWAVVLNIDAVPTIGDTITFNITYTDSTTETMLSSVDGVFTKTATLIWPSDGSTIDTTTPEFQWQCLSISGLTYSVQIDDMNHNRVYNVYDLPDGTTSHRVPEGYLNFGQSYYWLVSACDEKSNEALTNYDSFTLSELVPPPNCIIKLYEQGTTTPIANAKVGEFIDIYVGDSTGDITKVRFLSDENLNGKVDSGFTWTRWYDWNISSDDWDAAKKTKAWSFATVGAKEIWAEVNDVSGQTDRCAANILCFFFLFPTFPLLKALSFSMMNPHFCRMF